MGGLVAATLPAGSGSGARHTLPCPPGRGLVRRPEDAGAAFSIAVSPRARPRAMPTFLPALPALVWRWPSACRDQAAGGCPCAACWVLGSPGTRRRRFHHLLPVPLGGAASWCLLRGAPRCMPSSGSFAFRARWPPMAPRRCRPGPALRVALRTQILRAQSPRRSLAAFGLSGGAAASWCARRQCWPGPVRWRPHPGRRPRGLLLACIAVFSCSPIETPLSCPRSRRAARRLHRPHPDRRDAGLAWGATVSMIAPTALAPGQKSARHRCSG